MNPHLIIAAAGLALLFLFWNLPVVIRRRREHCIYCGRPGCDSSTVASDGSVNHYHKACLIYR